MSIPPEMRRLINRSSADPARCLLQPNRRVEGVDDLIAALLVGDVRERDPMKIN